MRYFHFYYLFIITITFFFFFYPSVLFYPINSKPTLLLLDPSCNLSGVHDTLSYISLTARGAAIFLYAFSSSHAIYPSMASIHPYTHTNKQTYVYAFSLTLYITMMQYVAFPLAERSIGPIIPSLVNVHTENVTK